jgi:Rod binding domain-containing protein
MNVSLAANWNRMTAANSPIEKPLAKNDVAKNEKAARDFEAMLLTPVLDALQKTFSGAQDSSTPGASDYRLMGTQALAQSIAARGGIGIGQLILRHLQSPEVPGGGGPGV